MKKYFKETWYMYVISFVLCFMLFLYEPIMLFLSNTSDFWFSLNSVIILSVQLFLLVLLPILLVFNVIYFINKKVFKIAVVVVFATLVYCYIQGNYLIGNLPVLDGSPIAWSNYKLDSIISFICIIVVIIAVVLIVKKVTFAKAIKYCSYVSIGIFLLLGLSIVASILTTKETLEKNYVPLVSYKMINKYSDDKNFIIFLLDCVDSKAFINRLNSDNDWKGLLGDFTYYPDTMSAHPNTTESIPFILTGKYYKNDGPLVEWSTNAYKDSYLFSLLEKNNYELNVYENDLYYYDSSVSRISNIYETDNKKLHNDINKFKFFKHEIKYTLFKYLPFFLKRYSSIEGLNFSASYLIDAKSELDSRLFNSDNYEMLKIIRENNPDIVKNNIFKFIHVDGAHVPWTYDKNYNNISNAKYDDEVDASITLTKEYLNMLKENKIYDNSVIIIMADHGISTDNNGEQRYNPILFVKGFGEKHKDMYISNKPIHFSDLDGLYNDLISGKKSSDVFKDVPNKRKRNFLYYTIDNKKNMIEYETEHKVWESDKAYKTGKVYTN